MALENQVACAETRGDVKAALAEASEMVKVIEPSRIYDSMRARAFLTRANCRIDADDLEGASADLALSWDLFNSISIFKNLPGPVAAIAYWWEVKSRILECHGSMSEAREAMAKSIENKRGSQGTYRRLALARALKRLGYLTKRCGDLDASEQALAEANSIRKELRLPEGEARD
jgi:hypothetical protein